MDFDQLLQWIRENRTNLHMLRHIRNQRVAEFLRCDMDYLIECLEAGDHEEADYAMVCVTETTKEYRDYIATI